MYCVRYHPDPHQNHQKSLNILLNFDGMAYITSPYSAARRFQALSSSAGIDSLWVGGQGLNKAESATHCGHAEGMPGEIRAAWMLLIEIEWNREIQYFGRPFTQELAPLSDFRHQPTNLPTGILTPENYHASKGTSTTWLAKGTGLANQNGWVAHCWNFKSHACAPQGIAPMQPLQPLQPKPSQPWQPGS